MTHDIAFLHTGNVHVHTFQKLVDDIDASIRVHHEVNESLLTDALSNGMTTELRNRIDQSMKDAAQSGAPVVVCTCSTIGGVAENSPQTDSSIFMRIDRAMADLAVETSKEILILAAAQSTLDPTKELLVSSSVTAGKTPNITLKLIEGAWPLFEQGDMAAYHNCIETYINSNHSGYDCIVLAQASMAAVANRFLGSKIRVLASPELGVKSAVGKLQTG